MMLRSQKNDAYWRLPSALLFVAAIWPSSVVAQSGFGIDAAVTPSDLSRAAEASHSRISVSQPTATVAEGITVTTTLLDAAEKPLVDRAVIVSWQQGDTVVGQVNGVTDARGTFQTVVTTQAPQQLTILAYDATLIPPLPLLQTASVIFEDSSTRTVQTTGGSAQKHSWFASFVAFVRGLFQ